LHVNFDYWLLYLFDEVSRFLVGVIEQQDMFFLLGAWSHIWFFS
jgi:hypothetical protein